MRGLCEAQPSVTLPPAMFQRTPCVYILASGFNGTIYVGVTSDLPGRIVQHREGTFGGFTARNGIKRLVWYEVGGTMESAIRREKQLKRWRRAWKMNLIERDNPRWEDLAVGLGLPPLGEEAGDAGEPQE